LSQTQKENPMGKMEQALKSEMIRLATKQMRVTYLPLAREVRKLKRTVAELRRMVAPLKVLGGELEAQKAAQLAKLEASPDEVKGSRISARLIKSLRSKLGISQGELATLVGVSAGAVGFWEQGKARPHGKNKVALVALRKLGKREVKKLLAKKKAEAKPEPAKKRRKRKAKVSKKR
jgi:DNA-binding transcriptional regulator YiaG